MKHLFSRRLLAFAALVVMASSVLGLFPQTALAANGCFTGSQAQRQFNQVTSSECAKTGRDLLNDCFFKATGSPSNLGADAFSQIDCVIIEAAQAEQNGSNGNNTSTPASSVNPRGCFEGNRTQGQFFQLPVTACATPARDTSTRCYFRATGTPVSGTGAFGEIACTEIAAAAAKNADQASAPLDCTAQSRSLNSSNCGIIRYIVIFTNALSALVGVVIVAAIIWGGIQYSAAGSNPQAVNAAREKIRNAIIALLLFIFMYAFLQWVIPGGLF